MSSFRKGSFSKTPLTRSQLAERQPRDDRGRFAKYDTMMIIDEFGNCGPSHPHERKFGYAVSVTDRPDEFGRITDPNRRRHGTKEFKARNDTMDEQIKITRRISDNGAKTFAYYVDKTKPPMGWNEKDPSRSMIGTLEYSVDHTLPKTKGNVMVVIDSHKSYKDTVGPMLKGKSEPGRTVSGGTFNSDRGEYMQHLQTHDYVSNAARGAVECGDPYRVKILHMSVHRIRENEVIGNKK